MWQEVSESRTFLKFPDGHHAMVGWKLPDAQRFVVTHSGTDGQQRMSSEAPDFPLHMTLKHIKHNTHFN